MHNGIPWWLVVVLHAIHFWPVTLGVIVIAVALFARWRIQRHRKQQP